MDTAIALSDVWCSYAGGVNALESVSLTIEEGHWTSLMGPSGSGKSTLLNLLDGLARPTRGRVFVLGEEISAMDCDDAATFRREHVGLVFQQFHLVPYLTALENVMLAQHYHSAVDRRQAWAALEDVQLADRAKHLPSQLSGGEQQRVCVARALVNDPEIVLADEPTANLDEDNERRVFDCFRALAERGTTLVVATHDRALGALARRIVRLEHGRIRDAAETTAPPPARPAPRTPVGLT